jgi:inner membrane protein
MTVSLAAVEFWHWWVAGIVLIIVETLAPGFFFLWMGVAAGATGFLLLVLPSTAWEYQGLFFAALSVVSVVAWRAWQRGHPTVSDQPALNRRGHHYLDRVLTLDEPIVNGVGKVRVDDSTWRIEGDDAPAGTRIKVVAVDGVILKVDRV